MLFCFSPLMVFLSSGRSDYMSDTSISRLININKQSGREWCSGLADPSATAMLCYAAAYPRIGVTVAATGITAQ